MNDIGSVGFPMPPGDYEVMVVDVTSLDRSSGDSTGRDGAGLSLVVLRGALKGQVVDLDYPADEEELLGLLGAHGTLTATDAGLALRLEV